MIRRITYKMLATLFGGIIVGSLVTYSVLSSFDITRLVRQRRAPIPPFDKLESAKITIQDQAQDILIQTLRAQNADLQNKNLELLKLTATELRTFNNEELGFSFKYPAWFGAPSFDIMEGEEGKLFYGIFPNVALEFGSATRNFSSGRGGWPTDYRGESVAELLLSSKVSKTIPIQGGEVNFIVGKGDLEPGNWFSEGTFGALVKLKGKEFQGLAFKANSTYQHQHDDQKLTLGEFEEILKTFVIK